MNGTGINIVPSTSWTVQPACFLSCQNFNAFCWTGRSEEGPNGTLPYFAAMIWLGVNSAGSCAGKLWIKDAALIYGPGSRCPADPSSPGLFYYERITAIFCTWLMKRFVFCINNNLGRILMLSCHLLLLTVISCCGFQIFLNYYFKVWLHMCEVWADSVKLLFSIEVSVEWRNIICIKIT